MITLYDDGASPNTEKVRIALAELSLQHERRVLDLPGGATKTPEFTAINPNQKVPALQDGDVSVWESGAILLYLADKHERFLPRAGISRARVLELMFFEANAIGATLGGPTGIGVQSRREPSARNLPHLAELKRELDREVLVLERVLGHELAYLAGDYSIADMQLFPVVRRGVTYAVIEPPPRLAAWLARVAARDAVRAALSQPG